MFPGMDPKLRLAHRLQFHLLPTGVPVEAPVSIAAVLESYCHLSGDLFGWGMRSDGRFLLWMLDVSGHGLETGLVSALVKLVIDSVGKDATVAELLAELNEALLGCVRPGGRELFATGFFIAVASDGSSRFCSAGHPPALVRTADGAIRELSSNALPVGLFPGERFAMEETRIGPDEMLFMYTDGLVELTTRSGEEFGSERLREFLKDRHRKPRELTKRLYRALAEAHDMTQLDDDVSFVAARMREA
jgi:sigma-B regulation protein RsbU (phosphoserine phosphatase)